MPNDRPYHEINIHKLEEEWVAQVRMYRHHAEELAIREEQVAVAKRVVAVERDHRVARPVQERPAFFAFLEHDGRAEGDRAQHGHGHHFALGQNVLHVVNPGGHQHGMHDAPAKP